MNIIPQYAQGVLPQSTIVPSNEDLFIPYFTRTYEALAGAINTKDNVFITIPISDVPTNIPNVANFGAFIVCVSGQLSTLPTLTSALSKSSATVAGAISVLGSQAGTVAPWNGATLTITSTATNFQIAHSVTGLTGNFNLKIIGTQ